MSSIISDIFYNKKNANLLDNYLINRQNSEYSVSNILDGSISNDAYTNIGINIKLFKNSGDKFMKRDGYTIRVKMGKIQSQDISQPQNLRQLHFKLTLLSVPLSQIYSHSNIRIQFLINNYLAGFSYIPIQNIIDLAHNSLSNNSTSSKSISLKLKSHKNSPNKRSINNDQYKIACDLKIKAQNGIKTSNYQGSIFSRKIEDKKKNQQSQPISYFGTSQQVHQHQISSILKSDNKPYPQRKHNNKTQTKYKHFDQKNFNTSQQGGEWTRFFNHPNTPKSEISQPKQISHQQHKRLIKFVIERYESLSENKQQIGIQSSLKYKIKLRQKSILIEPQALIEIWSDQYDKNGIVIDVIKMNMQNDENNSEQTIGNTHLNAVLLLGGIVEGGFPVCKIDADNCIGILKIKCLTEHKNLLNTSQINHKIQEKYQNSLEQQSKTSEIVSSFSFKFDKLLIMPKIKHEQNIQISTLQPKIIIRVQQAISCLTSKQIVIHHIHIQDYNLLQLQVKDIIKVVGLNGIGDNVKLQIQVYLGELNAGYINTNIGYQTNNERSLINKAYKLNLTTQQHICQSIITILRIDSQPNYLLLSKIPNTLSLLNSFLPLTQLQSKILPSMHHVKKYFIEKLMSLPNSPLFIECSRITDLLINSLIHKKYENTSITTIYSSTHKSVKFYDQLMYLDSQSKGLVLQADMEAVRQYYGVNKELVVGSRQCKYQDKTDQVYLLYLFMMFGYKIEIKQCQLKVQGLKSLGNSQQQNNCKIQPIIEKQKQTQSIKPSPQKLQYSEEINHPKYLINQVRCKNMNEIMKGYHIPSIKLQIGQQYTSRTMHRNANPTFNMHHVVSCPVIIKILHRDIRSNTDILLWQINFTGKQQVLTKNRAQVNFCYTTY